MYLGDLLLVLQDGPGGLGQVVQAGVPPQCLGEGAHGAELHFGDLRRAVRHGGRQPGLQGLGEVSDGLNMLTEAGFTYM